MMRSKEATMAHGPRVLPGPAVTLDGISKRIIEQLQQDGRRSYAAIGKGVGPSEAAVRQRAQRLLDARGRQIVAVPDPLTLGFRRQPMLAVKCDGALEDVADQLASIDEIEFVVVKAGSFVTSTETFVYLKLRKQTYSWGTR